MKLLKRGAAILMILVFAAAFLLMHPVGTRATDGDGEVNRLTRHEMILRNQTYDYLYFIDENGNQTTDGTWESSDFSVAWYSKGGWVQAQKPGTTIITYTSPDGTITDRCFVKVFPGLNEHSHIFYINGNMEPFQLFYTNADDEVELGEFTSDDTSVVTVSDDGWVTLAQGVTSGYATITFFSSVSGDTDTCSIGFSTSTYKLNEQKAEAVLGKKLRLAFNGYNGYTQEGIWTSSDESIAVVDHGVVIGVSLGTATITFSSDEGEDSCEVTVIPGLNYHELKVYIGEDPVQLYYTNKNGIKDCDFASTDRSGEILEVDDDGIITAVGPGTCDVVCLDPDFYMHGTKADGYGWPNEIDSCTVTVLEAPETGTLNKHNINIMKEELYDEVLYYIDENGNETSEGIWTSSDTSIVDVLSNGGLFGRSKGNAVIQYMNPEGELLDTCTVNVFPGLSSDRMELWIGGENKPGHLEFIGPYGGVEGTFTGYDQSIITISDDGTVTPAKVGATNVFFNSSDGKYSDICVVEVREAYALSRETGELVVGQGLSLFFYGDNGEVLEDPDWTSSNPEVAVYNAESHTVDALSAGEADFTFTYTDEYGVHTDDFHITVHPGLNYHELKITVGSDPVKLEYKKLDGTVVEGTYHGGPSNIITVDQNGYVTPVATGEGYVMFFGNNGGLDSCKVTVLFQDVTNPKKFYYDPVYWAVSRGITTGKKDADGNYTNFDPNGSCNRGEFVTFLWRLMGEPEPTKVGGFSDVKNSKKFFYYAVYWAAEQGITQGTSDTTFSPNDNCNRGQIVTFLWRAAGSPEPTTVDTFTDVKNPKKFFYKAVYWAAENGITTGKKDDDGNYMIFDPNGSCSRGEVVTFLYRYYNYLNN